MKCKAAHRTGSALSALNATIAFSRKFFRPIPLLKSQNSRSAPPLLTLSKILTDIFRTANNLSICKTTIHSNAGFASSALANAFISCDRSRLFEQDFPRSGRRVRQIASFRQLALAASSFIHAPPGHGGYSVQFCWLCKIWPVIMVKRQTVREFLMLGKLYYRCGLALLTASGVLCGVISASFFIWLVMLLAKSGYNSLVPMLVVLTAGFAGISYWFLQDYRNFRKAA